MAYTFNLDGGGDTLLISRVRSLIDDVTNAESPAVGTDYFLEDARILDNINAARELYGASWAIVFEAAAICQGTLATNQAYVLKKKSTMGEDVDGPAVADSIRADAKINAGKAVSIQAKADADASTPAKPARPNSGTVVLRPVFEAICDSTP